MICYIALTSNFYSKAEEKPVHLYKSRNPKICRFQRLLPI